MAVNGDRAFRNGRQDVLRDSDLAAAIQGDDALAGCQRTRGRQTGSAIRRAGDDGNAGRQPPVLGDRTIEPASHRCTGNDFGQRRGRHAGGGAHRLGPPAFGHIVEERSRRVRRVGRALAGEPETQEVLGQ